MIKDLEQIQNQIGYQFHNLNLLYQAFTRKSFAQENDGADNEILEFVGDRALDLVITKILMDANGYLAEEDNEYYSELTEGELTELKKRLVQRKTLAHRIDILGWSQFLFMGKGDIKNKVNNQESVREDLFEAVIGAVTIDSNWNLEVLEGVVELMLDPDSELENNDNENYVKLVQDWFLKRYGAYPFVECRPDSYNEQYVVPLTWNMNVVRTRPRARFVDLHNTQQKQGYKCLLVIDEVRTRFEGYGDSKGEARYELCKLVYEYLENNNLINTIQDEIDHPSKEMAINQLEILARRGYFSIPTYEFAGSYDSDGNSVWRCTCCIDNSRKTHAVSSSKKDAKKQAAYEMLQQVLGI